VCWPFCFLNVSFHRQSRHPAEPQTSRFEEIFMPAQKLKEFLDRSRVKYVTITHSLAYTAQEIAASAHIAGKELAKTVMVKIDDKMAMAVLPASYKVNFDLLKKAAGASKVQLANEQ
jgi:Ala-tRNA(Pro) deacylase